MTDEIKEKPKHIEEALIKRRNEIIFQLGEEKFSMREIQLILSWELSTQRINKIIIDARAKKLSGEKGK